MTNINRTIAEFDGFIFSSTGASARKGKGGPTHQAGNIKYDSYNKLMPVYRKVMEVAELSSKAEAKVLFAAVQKELLWGTVYDFRDKIFEFIIWLKSNQ